MNVQELRQDELRLQGLGSRWILVAGTVGLIGLLGSVGLALGTEHGVERFFKAYLVNFMFVLSLGLGALFFVLINHLTRAGWAVALRRLAEVMAWTVLPLTGLGVVLLFGLHELYEWTHLDVVSHDSLLQQKQPYLNTTFFVVRFLLYFLVWNLLAWFFLRQSTKQDETRDPQLTLRMERVAAPGMIFYALTVTFAAFDWIMTLYPHWYSTIFGVYFFAGCVLAFLCLVAVLAAALERGGKLTQVLHVEHYHDTGRLMFAFVVFWAYIAFSQYMLIWIANLPEETIWYALRQSGPWTAFSLLLLFGHFVAPFLWLLSKHMKRRKAMLVAAALWLLLMHWCDLYYLIMPAAGDTRSPLHWLDLTCLLFLLGVTLAAAFWRLNRVNLIPVGDPRLPESLGVEHG